MSLRDREAVVAEDLITYYKAMIDELEHRLKIRDKEIKASSEMNNYYAVQLNTMATRIDNLNQQIDELNKDKEYDKNRYEKMISDMNKDFMKQRMEQQNQTTEGLNLLFAELRVREQIQFVMLNNERQLKEEIMALKQILMVPKLQYKYIENMKLDALKRENERIVKSEIDRIAHAGDMPKSTKNTYRSLPRHKRSVSIIKEPSSISNFAFGDRSRKLSHFLHNMKSPMNSDEERLPRILNKTTDSTMTTLKSFRYDRSSPILDMTTIMNTSNASHKAIDNKRKGGNASQLEIQRHQIQ